MKPLTIEEMQAIAAARGGRFLSKEYVNSHTPLEWECGRGHRWFAVPNNVKRGKWCGACANEQKSPRLADLQRFAAGRGGRCLSAVYVNMRTPLVWECAEGHRWSAAPVHIVRGKWCRACHNQSRRTPLVAVQAAAQQLGGRCLSDKYLNNKAPMLFECAAGHRWHATAVSVRQGHWCPRCAYDRQRGTLEQMRALAASRDGECLSEHYVDSNTHLRWRCERGHEWESPPRVVRGHWCPECAWLARSKERGKVRKYLPATIR
jgi:hypothetical protein